MSKGRRIEAKAALITAFKTLYNAAGLPFNEKMVATGIDNVIAEAVDEAMQHMHPGTKQPAEPLEDL